MVPADWWRSLRDTLAWLWAATVDALYEYWAIAQQVPVHFWVLAVIAVIAVALASRR